MAKENNIPVAEAKRGDTITAGDLQFQVLSPESSDGKSKMIHHWCFGRF